MKKALFSILLAGMMSVLFIGSALAQTITIMNGTGFEIHGLGLSPSEESGDTQDLLGNDILGPGEGLQINFSGSAQGWDLIAVDKEGTQVTFGNLNLSGVSKVTLNADATANMQ